MLDIGESVTINAETTYGSRFSNNGFFLIDGDPAAANLRLNARMNGISGGFMLLGGAHGATLDVYTNMPGAQVINFGDANGVLKIETGTTLSFAAVGGTATTVMQNFNSRISGFQVGDTIDLAGLNATGANAAVLTYSYGTDAEYGASILRILNGSTTIARLRMGGGDFVAGTGTLDGTETGSFHLASGSGGDTIITVVPATAGAITQSGVAAMWNGVTTGGTVDWTAANWTGGVSGGLPGPYQTANVALSPSEGAAAAASFGGLPNYKIAVTTAQTVGAVDFESPFATLLVSAALTLQTLPGQTNGAGFGLNGGKLDIAAGGTISTSRMAINANAEMTVEAAGTLLISGVPSFTLGAGLAGLDIGQYSEVRGGTVVSAGNISIGANGNADFEVSNDITGTTVTNGNTSFAYGPNGASVSANYTIIGGPAQTGASFPQSSLSIDGGQSRYTDTGSDATTPLAGAMLVGGGNLSMNGLGQIQLGNGGNGALNVRNGATLTDAGFAMIAAGTGSSGTVMVSNGGHWNVGGATAPATPIVFGDAVVGTPTLWTGPLPMLAVGAHGAGSLTIDASGVQLGSGAAFATPAMVIGGGGAQASGTVSIQNSGASLDTGGGALVVGSGNAGTLTVGNGGTVHVGAAAVGTTGIGYGLGIGYGGSGAVTMNGGAVVDDADLVVGYNAAGTLALFNSAVMQAAGNLYIGGLAARNDGSKVIAASTAKGSASGQVRLNGGTMTVQGNTLDMWQGSTLAMSSGQVVVGTATALAGALVIGSGATLQGAGVVTVNSINSTLRNDGVVMAGGLTSLGTASQTGATLEIAAVLAGSGTFAIGQAATLQLDNGTVNTSNFDFGFGNWSSGQTAAIRVMAPSAFQGTVADFFGAKEVIDFVGAGYVGPNTLIYTANADPTTGGSIGVNTAAGTLHFHVTGYHAAGFTVASDGSTGTLVTANDAAACYVAGTRILTAAGERAVELLRVGDLVPSLRGGRMRRVVWVGATRIDLGRHPEPGRVAPVRDLVVSPDHAVWTGAALVPAYLLDNGLTILRDPARGSVTYVHVELDAHDLVLAEGLAAESYLDSGNRGLFAGAPGARPVHPDMLADLSARAWDERACVPLTLGGKALLAIHAELRARAAALGHGLTDAPDIAVVAGGEALPVLARGAGRVAVRLPAGTTRVVIASRAVVPNQLDPAHDDRRLLGVALTGLALDGVALALDGPACVAGFHQPEAAGSGLLRWTDGAATLVLPAQAEAARLDLTLLPGVLRYPVPVLSDDGGAAGADERRAAG